LKRKEKKDEKIVRVWNALLNSGKTVKIATIEQGPRKESMCDGCSAPCCKGKLKPVLTSKEFTSKKFPTAYQELPWHLGVQGIVADYVVTLNVPDSGCPYLDPVTNKCTIWPNCPDSCKAYDCREDDRPEMKKFAKQRKKVWRKERGERFGRNSRN